jgi:sugar lactone lactonase YvrE
MDFFGLGCRRSGPKYHLSNILHKKYGEGGGAPTAGHRRLTRAAALTLALAATTIFSAPFARAQGVLTVTPGRNATTLAGTGTVNYTGDNGAATSATLATPSAVAYDSAGNLYIADANNHVIREVAKATGIITTIAGTGTEGFSGDNGPATSAQLDTPTGVAVDATGNIYIADSHNQRIREVAKATGIITTIAGTGTAGFSGDGGPAASAQLSLPSGIAVDATGNIYIADTNNQRIREVVGTSITTIAGTGEQSYTGDNGPATSATLDSPTGIAVDASGNIYIADRHNQRIREVAQTTGAITTIAGTGTIAFGGSFSGDGSSANAATLSNPTSVSIDARGNIYIADTNNQRIRQIASGTIGTIAGTGEQNSTGDNGPASAATLDTPRAVTSDASGNIYVADTNNQRVRGAAQPVIAFSSQPVGVASAAQPVTLANTGTASITVSTIALTGAFTTVSGGTCSSAPITLPPGASCTQNVAYLPTAAGIASGSVTFNGAGVVAQTILLTGNATTAATTTTLTSNIAAPLVGQSITLTATVTPAGAGTATGTVTFYAGSTIIGSPETLASGSASITTSFTTAGPYTISAVYSGDSAFLASTSTTLTELATDFSLASASSSSSDQTVTPGSSASYSFAVAPLNGAFPYPVSLSATGLPLGATVTFTPSSQTPGSTSTTLTMKVQTVTAAALLERMNATTTGAISFVLLLVPFSARRHKGRCGMSPLFLIPVAIASLALLGAITGCGSGFFAQPQQKYTIQVTGTATGSNGMTLQRSTTVTLTLE